MYPCPTLKILVTNLQLYFLSIQCPLIKGIAIKFSRFIEIVNMINIRFLTTGQSTLRCMNPLSNRMSLQRNNTTKFNEIINLKISSVMLAFLQSQMRCTNPMNNKSELKGAVKERIFKSTCKMRIKKLESSRTN